MDETADHRHAQGTASTDQASGASQESKGEGADDAFREGSDVDLILIAAECQSKMAMHIHDWRIGRTFAVGGSPRILDYVPPRELEAVDHAIEMKMAAATGGTTPPTPIMPQP